MAEQQRQSLCPRLIDYLAIIGARTSQPPSAKLPPGQVPPVQVCSCVQFVYAPSDESTTYL